MDKLSHFFNKFLQRPFQQGDFPPQRKHIIGIGMNGKLISFVGAIQIQVKNPIQQL
jgi:hypothetical protein